MSNMVWWHSDSGFYDYCAIYANYQHFFYDKSIKPLNVIFQGENFGYRVFLDKDPSKYSAPAFGKDKINTPPVIYKDFLLSNQWLLYV